MSLDNSMDFYDNEESLHISPINKGAPIHSNYRLFSTSNPQSIPTINKSLRVITTNKTNEAWNINEEFENYLAEDDLNPDTVAVSFLGPKKNGKSFLVDSLVTAQTGKVCRLMSKNSTPLVNSPAHNIKTRNNDRIIYLDGDGQTSKQLFLWTYFVSSIIVYNMSPNDKNEEDNLFDNLYYVQSHLQTEMDDLSQPLLVIVRRDIENRVINDRDLIHRIEEYNLFQPEILTVHLPYPGLKGVKAKELVDVPLKELQPTFLNEVQRLLQIIKTGKPKIIKGNYLSSKIFSISLEPITRSINRHRRISTNQIWSQIIEILSAGYHNFYIKTYSQELQKQFSDEKPYDRYTIYKKLSKLRRRVNKKVEGFNNISDDPIFIKYKQKLDTTIKRKQELIREVNRGKSRQANEQYCKKVLSQINDANYAQLIDEYCKSELDDQKTEVLLENFDEILKLKSQEKRLMDSSNKPEIQLQRLQKQIADLDNQIEQEKKPKKQPQFDFSKLQASIKDKQSKLEQLQAEYSDLKNASKLMSNKKNVETQQIDELEEECNRLNIEIANCNKEIEKIRRDRQSKIKETTVKLENELKQEQQKLRKLEKMLAEAENMGQPKKGQAEAGKNSCCSVM